MRSRLLTFLLGISGPLVLVGMVTSPIFSQSSTRDKVERYATRQGNIIQLHPSEATFEVPEKWRGEKTSFLLTVAERRQKAGRDVWGTQIADAVLSLQDCAAQIAPDNRSWFRAYLMDLSEEEILKRIQKKGWAAAEKMPAYARGHSSEYQTVPTKEGPWMHVDIPYVLDFGDYNGEGYVSFYLRPVGGRTLVMSMGAMWSGEMYKQSDERQNLLRSVVIPDSPSSN
jgi:hypothetical protein